MSEGSAVIVLAAAVLVFVLLLRLFRKPIKWAIKLLLHAVSGFILLFLLNFFGSVIHISLEMTWLNAIVSGILGIPGVILLLLLKYIF